MLISHSHKFIKIDIQKTGSRAFRNTLLKTNTVDYMGGFKSDKPGKELWEHANIRECEEGFISHGWNFNEYFKYSIVRNPWKRYVSWLLFIRRRLENYKNTSNEEINKWSKDMRHSAQLMYERLGDKSESELLAQLIKVRSSQESFVCDDKGKVAVDMISTLENINDGFTKFCDNVNISPVPELEHANKSTYTKPYTEYYNKALINAVAKKEKWVIDKFGYEFGIC